MSFWLTVKGVGRKISGRRGTTKKKRPETEKIPKNSTIKPLPGGRGGATKKRPKIAKKKRKIAQFTLIYYICTMCKTSGRARPPDPVADAHAYSYPLFDIPYVFICYIAVFPIREYRAGHN